METVIVYPTKDNKAGFECVKCGYSKTIDIRNYLVNDKAIKGRMKCKCGHVSPFILERRNYFRKSMRLRGSFVAIRNSQREPKKEGGIIVDDISATGFNLKIHNFPDIRVKDKLYVEFRLDDSNNTLIEKEVIVRRIVKNNYGVEFIDKNTGNHINSLIFNYIAKIKKMGIYAV